MNPRSYWLAYIDRSGGAVAVADRLGIPYSTIASVTSGWRGIGRKLALRMAAADPTLDASMLAFVTPTKIEQKAA